MAWLSSKQRTWGQFLHALVTYDCFPVFSAKVRRLVCQPLGVLGLAAATALLCGLFLHAQGMVLFVGVMAVIALGILWPWLSLRGLSASLGFARWRCRQGESVCVRIQLRNHYPWNAWGLTLREGFDQSEPLASLASIPGRRTARCQWSFEPTRRGLYPRGVCRLGCGFPFGLWECSRPVAVESSLLVWPRTYAVGPVPVSSGEARSEGNVARNKVGSSGDVLGVRPYRRGDSPRRIHWGQSARHDRLIVCELQSTARPLVQLVLDTSLTGELREWAVGVAASFAEGWLAEGAQVGAVWNDDVYPPASGIAQTTRLLDGLALLDERQTPLPQTLASPACREFRDGVQVIITSDERLAEAGLPLRESCRFVVLRAAAFGGTSPTRLPGQPWLYLDSSESIPEQLRNGYVEAQHGS